MQNDVIVDYDDVIEDFNHIDNFELMQFEHVFTL